MKEFGLQCLGKPFNLPSSDQHNEIKEVLKKFQDGYTKRNVENADAFVDELFISGDDTIVLGTGTGELFLGSSQVKTLISDDWQYWGDVNINWENAYVDSQGDAAWFASAGTLKYVFEDKPERYDSYINFINSKAMDAGLSPKQKITFINWVLSLTYHQRKDMKREYLWPLNLSGVLLKENHSWKISHLHFSIPKADFPDERFENSSEHMENYKNQKDKALQYKNNKMTSELKMLLENLETKFFEQKSVSAESVQKLFASDSLPYIIGPENQYYMGITQVKDYFNESSGLALSLNIDHAIASKLKDITWVTVTGVLKQDLTEEELNYRTLEDLNNLLKSDLSSKEKLFEAHRSIAYVLKESASGIHYTCPVRLTAVIGNENTRPVFKYIHFSYPCYWIFEGKINSAQGE